VIDFRCVREASPLHKIVGSTNWKAITQLPNFYTTWNGSNWDTYYRPILKKEKGDNERRRRRLEERGRLTFECIEGDKCAPVIAWTLANQKPKAARPAHYDYLTLAASAPSRHGRFVAFTLKVDDELIATLLCLIDETKVEARLTAYDASFSRYAPGKILWGACLKWAFDRSLTFEMGFGNFAYKRRWANHENTVTKYEIANSLRYAFCLRWPTLIALAHRYQGARKTLACRHG